MHINVGVVNN